LATSKSGGSNNYGTSSSDLLLSLIPLCGTSYQIVSTILGIMGIPMESESKFSQNILPKLTQAVNQITKEFIIKCRLATPDRNDVKVMIDAGWSHPGWWARECTITALDGKTSLPISVFHVIKGKNGNFDGSSRGNLSLIFIYVAMEGFGVKNIMEELSAAGIKVSKVLHDKDASTLKQVVDVFEDAEEQLCVSKYNS
jgi:hypothetical protein